MRLASDVSSPVHRGIVLQAARIYCLPAHLFSQSFPYLSFFPFLIIDSGAVTQQFTLNSTLLSFLSLSTHIGTNTQMVTKVIYNTGGPQKKNGSTHYWILRFKANNRELFNHQSTVAHSGTRTSWFVRQGMTSWRVIPLVRTLHRNCSSNSTLPNLNLPISLRIFFWGFFLFFSGEDCGDCL